MKPITKKNKRRDHSHGSTKCKCDVCRCVRKRGLVKKAAEKELKEYAELYS